MSYQRGILLFCSGFAFLLAYVLALTFFGQKAFLQAAKIITAQKLCHYCKIILTCLLIHLKKCICLFCQFCKTTIS